jgi:hypothetical protein
VKRARVSGTLCEELREAFKIAFVVNEPEQDSGSTSTTRRWQVQFADYPRHDNMETIRSMIIRGLECRCTGERRAADDRPLAPMT